MNFTYQSYRELIGLLHNCQYTITSYDRYAEYEKCVIIRHDVDNSLSKALELAELEAETGPEGVKSTFFLLLTSDFYNLFSLHGQKAADGILDCGHEIGLHFDEMRYPHLQGNMDAIREKILQEAGMLSRLTGRPVTKVSMHRPGRTMLNADLKIPGMVNTYGSEFFRDFKYLSDSRRNWRETPEEVIEKQSFKRLQILIHPFWYHTKEKDAAVCIKEFVNAANHERYHQLNDNFTRLEEMMGLEELMT